jgi:hypothetical protein
MSSLLLRSALASVIVSCVVAQDPADSWLVYAKAAGNNSRVLSVNASWYVPSYPSTRSGGNAPGWWYGIEPNPANVLIQPILAYGDGSDEFTIFTGFYDWHNGNWIQSQTETVTPGQLITGGIDWNDVTKMYTQWIAVDGGKPISTTVSKVNEHGEIFTDVYFVVEHQPNSCTEYPASGSITFNNISIAWESGAKVTPDSWIVKQFKPACNSHGLVGDASSVKFTWDTK